MGPLAACVYGADKTLPLHDTYIQDRHHSIIAIHPNAKRDTTASSSAAAVAAAAAEEEKAAAAAAATVG